MRFAKKVALVTGGTGGLGKAVSLALLREGAIVTVTYIYPEEFEALQKSASAGAALDGQHIDVTDEKGNVTNWMVECGSPNIMLRRGFTKRSLEVGTEVTVKGYQAKNGTNRAVRMGRGLSRCNRSKAEPNR